MLTRSLVAFAAASMLFACTMAPAPPGSAIDPESNGKKSANDGDDTTDSSSSAASAPGSALDGVWDVTAMGDGPTGASQMTVKGGQITGLLVNGDEGQTSPTEDADGNELDDCVVAKDRVTFTVTITGDSMTGTFKSDFEYADANRCGPPSFGTSNVTATRTHASKNASAQTVAEGDWVVTPDEGDDTPPFAVTVAGLVGQVYDSAQKDNKLCDITVKSGSATASGSNVTFAARKR